MIIVDLQGVVKAGLRPIAGPIVRLATVHWDRYTRLFLISDGANWAVDHDKRQLENIAERLRIRTAPQILSSKTDGQCVFYINHAQGLYQAGPHNGNRIAIAYYHGRPGTPGFAEFDRAYEWLCERHAYIDRVQVTNQEMEELVISSGISREKVFKIPIGIDPSTFTPVTEKTRTWAREKYGVPEDARVVGSFQKDGEGWEEGREPKLIKGPDVFCDVVERLKDDVPNLLVLLSGPARGYVKERLDSAGIPYRHHFLDDPGQVSELYHAIDLYLLTSRQEGGPKMVLESMASRVPLVSTRVGQATEIVDHERNGWLADVEDVDALTRWARRVLEKRVDVTPVLDRARKTAEAHAYDRQDRLWREFFDGFVEMDA